MHKHLIGSLLVVTALFVCPARAAAQGNTFMQVTGILGDSTHEGHKDWIEVISLTQNFEAAVKASACSAAVTKGFDKAGPLLWLAAATGQRLGEVKIEVMRGGDRPLKFYELKISNARISAISSEPSSLAESLQIVGDAATLSYFPQDPVTGNLLTAVTASAACK